MEKSDVRTPSKPSLFLSYTRADIDYARRMISVLEDAGFDVWWDGLLEGGVNYLPTTEAALEGADCVVVLWSKLSVASNWVRDEAQSGRERGRLVPVSIDGTMAPLGFRQIQLLDISEWDGQPEAPEIARVVASIRNLIIAPTGRASGAPASFGRTASPTSSMPPATSLSPSLSRRNLLLSGAGVAVIGAGLGAWQFGLFSPTPADTTIAMAVLGFDNLSGEQEQTWFSDGLSNELRQTLARNPLLRVSAPTSSTANSGEDDFAIGRALGVPFILRGSVQRSLDVVRISVELSQVADGVVRWGETYDRTFADIFAVQSEIARTVALELVAQIAGDTEAKRSVENQKDVGGTKDTGAYEAFLRGAALADLSAGVDSDRTALAQFDAAIAADPAYAAAYARRATQLAAIANATSDAGEIQGLYAASIAAARQSVELEPALSRGHVALGYALNHGQFDRKGAEPSYRKAQEVDPGNADVVRAAALFYAYGDKPAQAMQMIDDVLGLDPLNARAFRSAAYIAVFARDFSKAIDYAMQALALNPNIAGVQYAIGSARFMQGDLPGALKAFETENEIVPLFGQVGLAITHAKLGDRAKAEEAYETMLADYGDASLYQQVQVLAQWGEIQSALDTLTAALDARDPGVLFAPNDPLLDPLRNDERFSRLLLPLSS